MYLDFISQNWHLFAMLAVIVFLLFLGPPSSRSGAKKLSPLQLPQVQSRQNAVIVDVSSDQDFKKGHIEQAVNFPIENFEDNLNKLNKYKNKSKGIILTCQNGQKSAKAAGILKKAEFEDLYILDGGLATWRKENLPLSKS